ncbi:MAG: DUF6485 family protein [Candidatus Aenigmarchaeota archaeon]|nr:DUF6485 family protein [Candidatus Aenigmarchaeota archaeon]
MKRKTCPNKTLNEDDCTCTYKECERHGICCLCIAFHRSRGEFPACLH